MSNAVWAKQNKNVDQIQPYSLVRVHYPKGWIKPTWPEGNREGLPEEGAPRQRCGGGIHGSTFSKVPGARGRGGGHFHALLTWLRAGLVAVGMQSCSESQLCPLPLVRCFCPTLSHKQEGLARQELRKGGN